jgi:hypothetical protein
MRRRRLDVYLLVESGARQLRGPCRIMRVGLVGPHRLQALMRLSRVDADDGDAQLAQAQRDRWRHPARLNHRAIDRAMTFQRRGDRLRRAIDAERADLEPIGIDDTDVRRFYRQVDSGIVLHGCFLPSGFDNQKCAPLSRPEEAATNYTMTHNHQMTVAAMAMVAMKLLMFRSKRMATRRLSLKRQNMRSMTLRCL